MRHICSIVLFLSIVTFEHGKAMEILSSQPLTFQNAYDNMLWPDGIIPFKLSTSIARISRAKDTVREAMNDWSIHTCITFVEHTNETDYVEFEYNHGCNADVGFRGGRQIISLDNGCFHKSKVLHEIGHVIGFWHEQSRPDRDDYVEIYTENIRKEYLKAFAKYRTYRVDTMSMEYDYHSIMHYKMTDFSKNGRYTILPKRKGILSLGNDRLSPLDIKKTIMLYKCNGWTAWGQWTTCDKSCEDGTQERRRACAALNDDTCRGTKVEKRICNLAPCPEWPIFPADFSFGDFRVFSSELSVRHLRAHRHKKDECLLIHENEDLQEWANYVFCNRGKRDIGMKWSDNGQIQGMKCTHIFEPEEIYGWDNNYLCLPSSAPYNFTWSYDGRKENMTCIKWYAKSGNDGWENNYLCSEGDKSPVDGSWARWTQWSECKTECGRGKRHRVRSCSNPRPLNEGRACVGSHLEEEECFKAPCRHSSCGGELKGTRGEFASPHFPSNYPSNVNCTWQIKCRSLKRVFLTITSMDIEKTFGTCAFDYLMIKEHDYNGKEFGRFCGTEIPKLITSTTNSLWISFLSDGEENRAGFTASWIHD